MNKLLVILMMLSFIGVVGVAPADLQSSQMPIHRITKFSVLPDTQSAIAVNDSFKDSLYVTDVVGMAAWQARILYNPSVIQYKSHKEGPFMTSVSTTWFTISLADTANGEILVGSLFWPPGEPYYTVSGSGSVLYITWKVKGTGKSPIRIRHEDTYLLDTLENHIPFDTVDGWYNPPGIAIFSPVKGGYWKRGNNYNIRWTSGGISPLVKIELWKGSTLDFTIASSTNNDCSHLWAIPADKTPGSDYKLKVIDFVMSSVYDTVNFNIYRQIQVTSPSEGTVWYVGSTYDITWITSGTDDSVKISYFKGSGSWIEIISMPDVGFYSWTIPDTVTPSTNAYVKVGQFDVGPNSSMSGRFTLATPPGVEESSKLKAQNLKLEIYPNPFSGKTVIRYSLNGNRNDLRLTIYDLTGRLVKSFPLTTNYSLLTAVSWDGGDDNGNRLPSGIYFCKLQVGDKSVTKQLLLLR
ncbi:MAG: T9SS type A sorting domain-containing protein [bacterium]|nr:T9SS type A sorting domain-containing protein [bacterium]